MSSYRTAQREESIYNLVPREYREPPKEPRYVSKFNSKNTKLNRTTSIPEMNGHRTMGVPKESVPKPDNFLQKGEGNNRLNKLSETKKLIVEKQEKEKIKPPVPRKDDQPTMGYKTTKNFISENAVDATMLVAKKPAKNVVDDRKGNKLKLETSGLYPHYIRKKEFGQVPEYIHKRKDEMKYKQEQYDEYIKEKFQEGAMKQITGQEHEELLKGLKYNWDILHSEYQSLSVITDTIPKMKRKEKMEREMKELEKEIDLLERHQIIYVAD
ncbi:hypothetical protein SNEBB_006180 [Seison nebaliae]|nr:hypothetical protein SNEBB_006180 [Seison nebaliae]